MAPKALSQRSFPGPVSEVQRGTQGGAKSAYPSPTCSQQGDLGADPKGSCVCLIPLARGACSSAPPAPSSGPPAGTDPARPPGWGLCPCPSFLVQQGPVGFHSRKRSGGCLSGLSPAPLQTELHHATEVVFPDLPSDHVTSSALQIFPRLQTPVDLLWSRSSCCPQSLEP